MVAESIRVTGNVQGVGFRPTVWRLAGECGVTGRVRNDASGVLIEAWGDSSSLDQLVDRLREEPPPLAVISDIQRLPLPAHDPVPADFDIVDAADAHTTTGIASDAATCDDCLDDIADPASRRYRYPFTSCDNCGPRLTVARSAAARRDTANTESSSPCPECLGECNDPADRRYRTRPNACPACGPRLWLEDRQGEHRPVRGVDAIVDAAGRLRAGDIVAIKNPGGFYLACLAENAETVQRLRGCRPQSGLALSLMARDVSVVSRYVDLNLEAEACLRDRRAPVVVTPAKGRALPASIAPGQDTLGFMLPYSPLLHLLLESFDEPLVMTPAQQAGTARITTNVVARERLSAVADLFLMHDQDIVNGLDDSVIAYPGRQLLSRARGFVPEPIPLHTSFDRAPAVLAMGGEQQTSFCQLDGSTAVVSQPFGDSRDAGVADEYLDMLRLYPELHDFTPSIVAVDRDPDLLPSRVGREMARDRRVVEVQHHHAHIAACLAEHGAPIDQSPVLGVVLDGQGIGEDGTVWGGEFLLADFTRCQRLAHFQPVALPGGELAAREPWRNTWSHLDAAFGWSLASKRFGNTALMHQLASKPVSELAAMRRQRFNTPLASSAGRLFDAVAAACGVCFDHVTHEGQAARELETLAARALRRGSVEPYPVDVTAGLIPTLSWQATWRHLLDDLSCEVPVEQVAARFHIGVAVAVANMVAGLVEKHAVDTLVLTGDLFENHVLLDAVVNRLDTRASRVLVHENIPANDSALSLGQATIAAARAVHPTR
ncbi:MAG: carbamoyltransferase HypF [Pseudomonadota bacterium]